MNERPLDLDELTGTQGRTPNLPSIKIESTPIDIATQREKTRTWLAVYLLGLLTVSLIGIGIYITVDRGRETGESERHREILTIVWTSQVTLVSAALGFYFGSESRIS
ncbi:MAG: hypothetical protein F6K32_22575 [Desertifilum sp. SIO1I2]|nr:hypothetical protein [Desertifilum sp. SIO1I2]